MWMPRSPDPRTVTLRTPAGARGCLDENEVVEHCRGVNSAAARAEVELHLDRCAGCRELVSELVLAMSDEGDEAVAGAATIAGPELSAERSPAGELAPPLRVGRYRIGAHVGSGGMGIVYAGHDPELGRTVALKLLAPRAGPDGEAQARLMLEAQAMARVSHPHVVAIHDVGVHEDRVWLAMEFIAGVTLAAWLRAQRRGWREVLAVFLAAGEGLAAVHAAGLVHRDFKPESGLASQVVENTSVPRLRRWYVPIVYQARGPRQDRAAWGPRPLLRFFAHCPAPSRLVPAL